MSRRSDPSSDPIKNRRKVLDDQAAKLKAKLNQAQNFLEKAPALKAEAQKREQQEILSTYRRPVRVEGPSDFRYELAGNKARARPPRLRKERSKQPLLTLVLLVAFVFVAIYAVRTLWQG
jgi:hypothetical protein